MQHVFAFNDLAVIVRHWYEVGETDEEHGARIELRRLVRHAHRGTASAAQVVEVDDIVWRADIFDVLDARPGNLDRAHFHRSFDGIEPVGRDWDTELSNDSFGWLAQQLERVAQLAEGAGIADVESDAADIRRMIPDIVATARSEAGDTCHDVASCLQRTRDANDVVVLMSHEVRPHQPGDPRLSATTHHH